MHELSVLRSFHNQIVEISSPKGAVLDVIFFDWQTLSEAERRALLIHETQGAECHLLIVAGTFLPFALVPTMAPEKGDLREYLDQETSGILLLDHSNGEILLSDGESIDFFAENLRSLKITNLIR